jgi:hypothetical protein
LAKQKREELDVTAVIKDDLNAFIKCAEAEEGPFHHLQ